MGDVVGCQCVEAFGLQSRFGIRLPFRPEDDSLRLAGGQRDHFIRESLPFCSKVTPADVGARRPPLRFVLDALRHPACRCGA